MTREEAMEKWCPFARASWEPNSGGAGVLNRSDTGEAWGACMCLADGCMAWRVSARFPEQGWCGLAGVAGISFGDPFEVAVTAPGEKRGEGE